MFGIEKAQVAGQDHRKMDTTVRVLPHYCFGLARTRANKKL